MKEISFEVEDDPNKDVFEEGDPPDRLMVVCEGGVLLYHLRRDGSIKVVRIARAGEVLGLAAVVLNQPYAFSAKTLEPTRMHVIKGSQFLAVLDAELGLWKQVALGGARRYYDTLTEVKKDPLVRLVQLLLSFCEISEGPETQRATRRVPMTIQQLADAVGVSERQMRRYLAPLRKKGLTTREHGWLVILDPQGLRDLLEKIK